jgi:hypothetical protein
MVGDEIDDGDVDAGDVHGEVQAIGRTTVVDVSCQRGESKEGNGGHRHSSSAVVDGAQLRQLLVVRVSGDHFCGLDIGTAALAKPGRNTRVLMVSAGF